MDRYQEDRQQKSTAQTSTLYAYRGQIKLLVQGLARAHADEIDATGPVLQARITVLKE